MSNCNQVTITVDCGGGYTDELNFPLPDGANRDIRALYLAYYRTAITEAAIKNLAMTIGKGDPDAFEALKTSVTS